MLLHGIWTFDFCPPEPSVVPGHRSWTPGKDRKFPPSRCSRTSAFKTSRQRSPVNEIERAQPCKFTYFVSTGDELSGTVACTMPPRYLESKPTPTRGSSVALHIASAARFCGILSRCPCCPRFSAEMTISISQGAVVENSGSRLYALDQHLGLCT